MDFEMVMAIITAFAVWQLVRMANAFDRGATALEGMAAAAARRSNDELPLDMKERLVDAAELLPTRIGEMIEKGIGEKVVR